jgi:hypothetical protein
MTRDNIEAGLRDRVDTIEEFIDSDDYMTQFLVSYLRANIDDMVVIIDKAEINKEIVKNSC